MAKIGILAAGVAAAFVTTAAFAQVATTLEQAELAGLSPQVHSEVEARMKQGGQTVYEILTTILLNDIKLKHPASQIVALDFNRGAAVVQTPSGGIETYKFNTTTLQPVD